MAIPSCVRFTCSPRCSKTRKASSRRCWKKSASVRKPSWPRSTKRLEKLPKVSGESAQVTLSNEVNKLLEQAFKEASNFKDEYVSTEHSAAGHHQPQARSRPADPRIPRRDQRCDSESARSRTRLAEGHRPESRSQIPGSGQIRSRPHRAGAPRQARSRHRTRRRNPPCGPGPLAPHEK